MDLLSETYYFFEYLLYRVFNNRKIPYIDDWQSHPIKQLPQAETQMKYVFIMIL